MDEVDVEGEVDRWEEGEVKVQDGGVVARGSSSEKEEEEELKRVRACDF